MSRRKLEAALQAGQCIAKGKNYPDKFTSISIDHDIKLEPECRGVYALQYSFDGKFLAIGCGNGVIRLYDTKTGQKLPDIRKSRYGGYPIMVLRFFPDDPNNPNLIYAGTSEGQVLSCDISDFVKDGITSYDHIESEKDERWTELFLEKKGKVKNEINCMDFDFPGECYATAGKDFDVRIYDASTNKIIRTYSGYSNTDCPSDEQFDGCSARIFALKYHPEYDHIFVTGGWDNQVKIWDSRDKSGVKRTIFGPLICGDALDLRQYEILTGAHSAGDALQIWDYSRDYKASGDHGKVIKFPSKEGPYLYAAQFCDNDVVIAGGKGTNSAMAINSQTQEVIGEVKFDGPVQAIDTVMGGRLFAVGDGKQGLKMCSLR